MRSGQIPDTTKLVDPDEVKATYDIQTQSAEGGIPADDGIQYVKLISLAPDVGADRGSVQRAPGLYGALQAARYASGVAGRGDTHRTPAPHTRTITSTSCSCSATVK